MNTMLINKISGLYKIIKFHIDRKYRKSATPIEGSVLYCDLYNFVEHSGIYLKDNSISNIVVNSLLRFDSSVKISSPESFTSKSLFNGIYVSCNSKGAVGNQKVASFAKNSVGQKNFYGLIFSNCHSFSSKCIQNGTTSQSCNFDAANLINIDDGSTSGLGGIIKLKKLANQRLSATKWRLWDWDGSLAASPDPEPDWQDLAQQLQRMPLNAQNIPHLLASLAELKEYATEIADENIPSAITKKLHQHIEVVQNVTDTYAQHKDFLQQCAGSDFSYDDLKSITEDFSALAQEMRRNTAIQSLAHKMGRAYISEERKKQARIPQASKSEVHGTHLSDDVMRMLPSELLNLEDEALEHVFYAKLLEQRLQTYELQGSTFTNGETTDTQQRRTGPVVACLDTSGSMAGTPLRKAKALLLAIAQILEKEQRSLHVLLFGSSGQIHEFSLQDTSNVAALLKFLQQGFGGGTNFEAPLQKACDIIAQHKAYEKADVLMISDGDCSVSGPFVQQFVARKAALDCMVYSVLCNGQRVADNFSDEVVVLT